MKIIDDWHAVAGEPVEQEGVQGATKRLLVGPRDGAPNFALRIFTLAPGGHTPWHRHGWEHENLILEGRGVLQTEQGEVPLRPGMVLFVAPDELHQFQAAADAPLSFVCLVPNAYA